MGLVENLKIRRSRPRYCYLNYLLAAFYLDVNMGRL